MFWRKTLATKEGQFGLDWLRQNRRRVRGETDLQMVREAAKMEGYWDALEDIEDVLTKIPQATRSLEEPPLSVGRDD